MFRIGIMIADSEGKSRSRVAAGSFPEYQSTRAAPAAIDSCTRLPRTPLFLQSSRHNMSLSDSICKGVGNKENCGFSLPPKRWGCTSLTVRLWVARNVHPQLPPNISPASRVTILIVANIDQRINNRIETRPHFLRRRVRGGEFFALICHDANIELLQSLDHMDFQRSRSTLRRPLRPLPPPLYCLLEKTASSSRSSHLRFCYPRENKSEAEDEFSREIFYREKFSCLKSVMI